MTTTTSPFDDHDAQSQVLVNDAGDHSLWPAEVDMPIGWAMVFAMRDRQACLDYIETAWVASRRGPAR